ncbi:RagB/SusD family nutrient uptake outer membrane protein [Pedobacter yulinensis]|uniref:RagB/SusD family nutrient uptake outer membrane protein n=1 Tax=Pedobacter yulinensis TaxID=2126353 RepID=A0A2T3HK97_9SPHI|nr:RagB/SusD family nutrient uptake outer membrane protein [Pedobacter yulinensis]PST82888.1 RagB/SusD family nutrient uptake outer membrane protein [Pedobacter yulinensis]
MKKIFILLAIGMASCLFSCQKGFLDQVPDDRLTIDDVFQRRATTLRYLANVYSYIRSDVDWNSANSPWEGLSDEIDITYNDYPTYSMNLGNWDRNLGDYNYWNHYYRGIRAASYFIDNVGKNPELQPEEMERLKAEARFLRAMYYFMIMRQYGPVVLLPETPLAPDATIEEMSLPRSPFDVCVDYVAAEMDKSLPALPVNGSTTDESNYGRINRGMVLAFKSRMLLYAASALYNGNTDYAGFKNPDGTQLISQVYNAGKWKRASDAAKAVIDLNNYSLYRETDNAGNLKPYESLKNVFLRDWNSEIIMARVVGTMYAIDQNGAPKRVGGWSSWGPTQQAVDAYFTANGRSITDPASNYSETGYSTSGNSYYDAGTYNMYVNREPRFYVAITFNGSKWINTSFGTNGQPITIQMFRNGNSGKDGGRNWSRTGYVVRKMVNPSSTQNPSVTQQRTEVLFRLAEVYLNYAEALNEAEPGNADIVKYLNLIRERAGIPQYGPGAGQIPVPATQDAMREAIRKERRVELAFEYHRYFDTRRWKIAEQTDGGPFYGMDIEATTTEAFSKRVVFETRVFHKKYYLWNIQQSELNKDKNLVGNPGW